MALLQWTLTQGVFLWFSCTLSRQTGKRFGLFHFETKNMCERAGNCVCLSLSLFVSFQSWQGDKDVTSLKISCDKNTRIYFVSMHFWWWRLGPTAFPWILSLRLAELPQHLIGAHSSYISDLMAGNCTIPYHAIPSRHKILHVDETCQWQATLARMTSYSWPKKSLVPPPKIQGGQTRNHGWINGNYHVFFVGVT